MKLPTNPAEWTEKHLLQARTEANNISRKLEKSSPQTEDMLYRRYLRAEEHVRKIRVELQRRKG